MSERASLASQRIRQGRDVLGALGWLALLGFLAFAEYAFAARWHTTSRFPIVLSGTATCSIVIGGWIATSVGMLRHRRQKREALSLALDAAGEEREIVEPQEACDASSDEPSPPNPIEASKLSRWVNAVNRLLTLELVERGVESLPRVNVVRAGSLGIELLLDSETVPIPRGFVSFGNGRVWRVDPALRLEEIEANVDASVAPYLSVLVCIGTDRGASYYVAARSGESIGVAGDDPADTLSRVIAELVTSQWADTTLYRLGEGTFLGEELLPLVSLDQEGCLEGIDVSSKDADEQARPVIVAADRGLAELVRGQLGTAVLIGTAVEADCVLYRSGDSIAIEPAGLTVHLDAADELFEHALDRLRDSARLSAPEEVDSSAELDETRLMPPQGEIEVRILREHPDLVGDLSSTANAAAVQFLGYLATHGGRASTARLRDALGAYHRESSRTTATVRAAAGAARQAVGSARLPNASANQQYELSVDVTCDWIRFEQALKRARGERSIGETARVVSLLSGALDLVAGLPSPDERRFEWMDAEGLSREIAAQVVEAAHLLFTIATTNGSPALARWALEKGRLADPESEVLESDEDEMDRIPELRLVSGEELAIGDGKESKEELDFATSSALSRLVDRASLDEQTQF